MNRNPNIRVFLILVTAGLFSSCSSEKLHYPLTEKKYKDDTISVQTAIELAYSAYLKGCVDRSLALGAKQSFDLCSTSAKNHVKDNIIFILDENNKPK